MNDTKSSQKAAQPSADTRLWKWSIGGAAVTAALAGAALLNQRRARKAERDNPPIGNFIEVDGVRLHYFERGVGRPLVLLHGNGTMIEDWLVSGMFDKLAATHRVIAFDRPGFGHSERPRSRIWTPAAQAKLFAEAFRRLDVERPIVVGHSFGTLVTVALALDHRNSVSHIALLGGYFYPSFRGDVLVASQPAVPVVGDVMRYTISPLIGTAMLPRINARIFNPAPVPEEWVRDFPHSMVLRPSQIRAEAAEAALMVPAAATLAPRLNEINVPVTIIAGTGDELVEMADQSKRLHEALPGSRFVPIDGAGHMVHHSATDRVIAAIRQD
jgi:pimeloyl-ACP methyl ester carboxylesterase